MIGVDYDCEQKKVYWTDITSKMIQRSNYDGSKVEIVVEGLSEPQGLCFDENKHSVSTKCSLIICL